MSLTRKALAAMGIGTEQIDQIIEMHTETVEGLKEELKNAKEEAKEFKADAKKLEDVQQELDKLKENADKPDPYKQKYNDLKKEFEDYKSEQDSKAVKAKKIALYKELLKEAKVSEKRIDAVIRLTDFDKIELDEEGKAIKDVETQKTKIAEDWSDYIVTEEQQGAKTPTPPANDGSGIGQPSMATQKAMAYHNNLYGVSKQEG